MNRCSYHEEGFQFAVLSIDEMRTGTCGFCIWRSLRDGGPTEWKAWWWWWKAFLQEQVEHLCDLPVQWTVDVGHEVDGAKGLSSVGKSVGVGIERKQL